MLVLFCIAGPIFSSKDGGTPHDMEHTPDGKPSDAEGDRLQNTGDDRQQDTEGDTNIMGITIHGTDCLVPDVKLIHPLMQLHIVDMETGQYMKKSDKYLESELVRMS